MEGGFLLDKSDQNKVAAGYLLNAKCYAAIGHCCYYSCFQSVCYCLYVYFPDEVQAEIASQGFGSDLRHGNAISLFTNCMANVHKNVKEKIYEASDLISELRRFRKKSDYSVDEILPYEAQRAKEKCDRFHALINPIIS